MNFEKSVNYILDKAERKEGKGMLKWSAYAICHVGKVRKNNEDNLMIDGNIKEDMDALHYEKKIGHRFHSTTMSVCDGMGGEENGEFAAVTAVEQLKAKKIKNANDMVQALNKANEIICEKMTKEKVRRIGSTAVAIHVTRKGVDLVNIGDSRAYRYREEILQQMSLDHTELQSKLNLGIPLEEIKNKSAGNRLTQHLGIFPHEMVIEPFIQEKLDIEKGDIWLLCSDGLCGFVEDEKIAEIMGKYKRLSTMGDALFKEALSVGGKDNISVVLMKIH